MQDIIRWLKWFFSFTLPAGRLFGIPLRVHLALLIWLPFLAWALSVPGEGIVFNLLYALLYAGILYLSVLAHEFGHAWGCRLVGGRTDQIILTPVGGLHIGTGGIESPRSELIVVALGPAVSIVLALIGYGAWWLIDDFQAPNRWLWLMATAVFVFAAVNTMLTLFNLLFPLFPMDSARLIRAGFSLRKNPQRVTLHVCQFGIGLAIFVMICAFFGVNLPFFGRVGPWLFLIAILGIQGCLAEKERIRHMEVYTHSDDWGSGPVYYDNDLVRGARHRAEDDLRSLIRRKRKSVIRKSKPVGPAKVIEIAASRDPDEINDLGELRTMMRKAAESEDFQQAARIKRRVRELENAGGSASSD